ncbi:MAG TPA: type II toxin-antitoxin system HicB family antitoxin [Ardenticatenaceae bacterium]|nr:type II toxin-antitoxin system HicB family antitoxin [Ardenticatenaceae bacterium]
MMQYKGYSGQVEFDDEAGIFHGEVVNIRDVITFQGKSVAELRQAFEESIEDYLAFCTERGEEPDQPSLSAQHPRFGWEEQFRLMAERGDDQLLDDVPNQATWDDREWDW